MVNWFKERLHPNEYIGYNTTNSQKCKKKLIKRQITHMHNTNEIHHNSHNKTFIFFRVEQKSKANIYWTP